MSDARLERAVWKLLRQRETRFRRFDTEALAFNPLTWETHLLTGNAVPVVTRLLASPASLDELVHAVAAQSSERISPDALRKSVSHVLEELHNFELIVEESEAADADSRV